MKETFVLDENAFIQAHTCKSIENENEDDFCSFELLTRMFRHCNNVGLSNELIEKYQEKSKMLERSKRLSSSCARLWSRFLYRTDKWRKSDNHLNNLPENILHDRHVIEPALFLGAILVTTDIKLKNRLKKWCQQNRQEIRVMLPKDAVAYLDRQNNDV